MSDPEDIYESAKGFIAEHRVTLVREVLDYRETAVIGEGRFRELRDLLAPLGNAAVRLAESMVADVAMKDLRRIYDQAAEPRAVLAVRLSAAGARRSGGQCVSTAIDDARDGALMLEAADALRSLDRLQAAASRDVPQGKLRTTDPMEQIVEAALLDAKTGYLTDEGGENPAALDFYLPGHDLHVEVKRMHSERIADQMSRAENVIAAQGEGAVRFLADLLRRVKGAASE